MDVLQQVLMANEGRKLKLVELKLAKIDESFFAFFRGTAHLFADIWNDLTRPGSAFAGLLAAPPLLSCGDLHVDNFGAYESDDGDFVYDINDFDEALVVPASFDLIRCLTSIVLAAEAWKLAPNADFELSNVLLSGYRRSIAEASASGVAGRAGVTAGSGPIWKLLGDMATANSQELLDRHTKKRTGERRLIESDDKQPPLGDERRKLVVNAIESYGQSLDQAKQYQVVDATGRIAGVGSLGVRRYVVLTHGEGSPDGNWLLDVKQCLASVVARAGIDPQPKPSASEAERVVTAQRVLQAKPTARLGALMIDNVAFRVRQMIPDENRSKLERFHKNQSDLSKAIAVAGQLIGWSHLRGSFYLGADRQTALASWAASDAISTLPAIAAECAHRMRKLYDEYHGQYHHADPKPPKAPAK
jgi:uncharacterized protein (DUF2252 family)